MEQVHVVRHKVLIEGKSQRQVAADMGLSRNTVKKYLSESEPKRLELNPRRRPVLDQGPYSITSQRPHQQVGLDARRLSEVMTW